MQLLVAFAAGAVVDVVAAVLRTETAYAGRWEHRPRRRLSVAPHSGVVLWEGPSCSRWPAWVSAGSQCVASVYAPVGYERVVAAEPMRTAPVRLAEELERCPSGMQMICPPFVLTSLDRERDVLTIRTDSLGIGRLYEARTPWGWVWSNRPEAALAFAGLPYRMDEVTWAQTAATDEMFGHGSPYHGVRQIDAATCITWDGRSQRLEATGQDPITSWSAASPPGRVEDLLDAAADALSGVARSIGNLFPETPVVALTGGRDSRLVASAFVAAGTDIRLTTHDALPEDLELARDLIGLLPNPPEHLVKHVATGNVAAPPVWEACANAAAWHDYAEGLRPYSYLHATPPLYLDISRPVTVGGVGGEVAHGFFYPGGRELFEELPQWRMISRFTDAVMRRYVPVDGPQPDALSLVRERIHTLLLDIAAHGYENSTVLDVFYVRQRMRRWGTTGERPGTISPLVSPDFIRACIGLTPEQRKANLLHRELTRRLVPRWAEPPYYPSEYTSAATGRTPVPPRIIRLADARDRHAVDSWMQHTEMWGDVLRPDVVHSTWENSIAGLTDARHERLLRAVVWRAAFLDRVADLNGAPRPSRPHEPRVPEAVSTPMPPDSSTPVVPVDTPRSPLSRLARHTAGTDAWIRTRDSAVGQAVRSAARAARRAGVQL